MDWIKALEELQIRNRFDIIQLFEFDNVEDVNYIVGLYNYKTFPRKNNWTCHYQNGHIEWSRSGLGVFDFKLIKCEMPLERQIFVLVRKEKNITIRVTVEIETICKNQYVSIGDYAYGDKPIYSTVCGRSTLRIISLDIQ